MNSLNFKIFLFLTTIFVSCKNHDRIDSENTIRTSVIIAGHFENVVNKNSLSNIGIYAKDYITQETFNAERKMDSTAKFKFEFNLTRQQDVMILYNGIISLITEPGDSIYLVLDGSSNSRKDLLSKMRISGSNAELNQQLTQYYQYDPIDYDNLRDARRSLSKFDFKKFKDSIYKQQGEYIDQILKNNNPDEPLKNWLKAEKLFGLASTYNFTSYTNTKIKNKGEFHNEINREVNVDFRDKFNISSLPKIREEHLINTKISNKISSDIRDFYALKNHIGDGKLKEGWERNTMDQSLKENIDNPYLSKLIVNQVIQTSLTNSNRLTYEENKQLVDSILNDTDYMFYIKKKYDEVLAFLNSPIQNKNIKTVEFQSDKTSEMIDEIVKNANGKVIYIDHWGTWCTPCIKEFAENTPNLVKQFQEDVEFVYLCYRSNKEQWKVAIAKYQLEGKHYFIDDEIIGEMLELFTIKGFPTYTIIDSKGELIESSSDYRPGNPETGQLLKDLIK